MSGTRKESSKRRRKNIASEQIAEAMMNHR
jgi:hypothetical protein